MAKSNIKIPAPIIARFYIHSIPLLHQSSGLCIQFFHISLNAIKSLADLIRLT
ncbi:hypothetical protein HMPREF0454_04027 [Hafnia alvei ATCC 51873]|uniref:Uncharacterized protein n=1 Tax=Hafnia alvei ATCC 51873 TaxID=1002364 RepID=G9YBJ9_HAFAL|nr:hypothetical protein HMPREF0454_04027 [Hafnia alvei ATCC 51873]